MALFSQSWQVCWGLRHSICCFEGDCYLSNWSWVCWEPKMKETYDSIWFSPLLLSLSLSLSRCFAPKLTCSIWRHVFQSCVCTKQVTRRGYGKQGCGGLGGMWPTAFCITPCSVIVRSMEGKKKSDPQAFGSWCCFSELCWNSWVLSSRVHAFQGPTNTFLERVGKKIKPLDSLFVFLLLQ